MSKRLMQLLALILTLALGTCVCFASPTVVSPGANSVHDGDSILVSVKLTEKQTVRISVLRQMEEVKAAVTEITTDEEGNEQVKEVSPAEYKAYDASKLSEADVALIAAGETQDAKGNPVRLSNGAAVITLYGETVSGPVDYTNNNELGFYTKQISSLKPGLYVIQVDVLGDKTKAEEGKEASDGDYEILESVRSYVALKEKPKEEPVADNGIFSTRNSALQFLQNLLRSLFK
jgi:hypothetical protein